MTSWTEMTRAEFDTAGLTKKQRAFNAAAAGTLYPRFLIEPEPAPAKDIEPEIDGQLDLLGGEA